MVKRRKVLFGIGALAAGGAAATATGAFTSAQMDREADIDVVNDADGLIALIPGESAGGRVFQNEGELKIDFTSDEGGEGVNINSRYQAGALFDVPESLPTEEGNSPTNNPGFKIINNDTVTHTIGLGFAHGDGYLAEDGSRIVLQARPGTNDLTGNGETLRGFTVEKGNESPSLEYSGSGQELEPGGYIGVSLLVDTTGKDATTEEDLSGTLTVTAGSGTQSPAE